jgi:hypothetical protein
MTSVTEGLTIGQRLTRDQINALPVGARIKWHDSEASYEHREDGWYNLTRSDGSANVSPRGRNCYWSNEGNVLEYLPSAAGLLIEGRSYLVGDQVTTRTALQQLPIGTQIRHTASGVIRTRTRGGWRSDGGAICSPSSGTISLINTVVHALPATATAPVAAGPSSMVVAGHTVTVGGRLPNREVQAAMPIGTVIFNPEVNRRRTRVADGWLREDTGITMPPDTYQIGLMATVVEYLPPVEETVTAPSVEMTATALVINGERFEVGQRLGSRERQALLPVGTVLFNSHIPVYRTLTANGWERSYPLDVPSTPTDRRDSTNLSLEDCVIESLPTADSVTEAAPSWMVVGALVDTPDRMAELPVGTVLEVRLSRGRTQNNSTWTKGADRHWVPGNGGRTRDERDGLALNCNYIQSLPGQPVTPTTPPWMVVGQVLTRPDRVRQMQDMPVGSKVEYKATMTSVPTLYRKVQDDRWVPDVEPNTSTRYCNSQGFDFASSITTIAHLPVQEGSTVTATTLDLEAIPIGGTLTTTEAGRGTAWTRTEAGFTNSATPVAVPLDYFTGIVAAGLATVGQVHVVNDVWTDGSYFYLIYHVDTEGRQPLRTVTYVLRDGVPEFQSYNQFQRDVQFGRKDTSPPRWTQHALEQARQYHAQVVRATAPTPAPAPVVDQSQVDRLNRQLADANTRFDGFRSGVTRMAEAMVEVLESNSIEWCSVDDEMESLGLPCREREEEDIDVTIEVSGRSSIDVTSHGLSIADAIGGDVAWDEDYSEATLSVCWSRSFTHTTSATEGSCGCGNVDRSDVEEHLRLAGVNYDSFDYELECSNC